METSGFERYVRPKTYKHVCKRCGYGEKEGEWESTLERPKVCTRCKTYFWDQEFKRRQK